MCVPKLDSGSVADAHVDTGSDNDAGEHDTGNQDMAFDLADDGAVDLQTLESGVEAGSKCGDGNINPNEKCDGTNLAGQTCATQGYDAGKLTCKPDCTALDTSSCIKHDWVTIPAGTFKMGSPASEPCHNAWESSHSVTLTNAFYMSAHETTQHQFKTLMGYNPSKAATCGLTCPVEWISWHEAAAYCNALSAAKGLGKCYLCGGTGASVSCSVASAYSGSSKTIYDCPGFRLPTDAEHEYANRGGTQTAFWSGAFIGTCTGTDANLDKIGWYDKNSAGKPHPVGTKVANKWGLYDTTGNVFEWAHDFWEANLGTSSVSDPFGPSSGGVKTMRGGSWNYPAMYARSAYRSGQKHDYRDAGVGVRCVRTK